jgi:hypothetical protein
MSRVIAEAEDKYLWGDDDVGVSGADRVITESSKELELLRQRMQSNWGELIDLTELLRANFSKLQVSEAEEQEKEVLKKLRHLVRISTPKREDVFPLRVTGYEVHARSITEGVDGTVFRIWDGCNNEYVSDSVDKEMAVVLLMQCEGLGLTRGTAVERVANAERNGFETTCVTAGELQDDWWPEGQTIERSYL